MAARGATETLRRGSEERGQGLVEYALILALVSLAAILALTFLSGKINGLFSKAGNSINGVQVAAGGDPGSPGGGTPATPPAGGTTVTGPGIPSGGGSGSSQWWPTGAMDEGPAGLHGLAGVYANVTPSQSTCSVDFNGDGTADFSGTWIPEPGGDDWDGPGVDPPGSDNEYDYACLASPPFTAPSNNTDVDGTDFSKSNSDSAEWWGSGTGTAVGTVTSPGPPNPAAMWDSSIPGGGTWFYFPQGSGGGSGVWVCTWKSVAPSSAEYDFPGSGHVWDEYCN
jgi:pilus assembly protein Flp/PilA